MSKVLVIDDESPIRKLIGTALSQEGYNVDSASTGTNGLKLLMNESYNLLITDLFLPGECGLTIIDILRQKKMPIKIIAISGGQLIDKTTILQFAKIKGADHCLQKPFTIQQLLKIVKNLIGSGRKNLNALESTESDCG